MSAMDREMEESKKPLTEEELRYKANLAALRLKIAGLDEKVIRNSFEEQRIPEELARQIAMEVMREEKREYIRQARPVYKFYFD